MKAVMQKSSSQHSENPSISSYSWQNLLVIRNFLECTVIQRRWLLFPLQFSSLIWFLSAVIILRRAGLFPVIQLKLQPASQSLQAAPHRAFLKLLNALLIPVLPWLQLVDPAFSKTMNGLWSLWLFLCARSSSEPTPTTTTTTTQLSARKIQISTLMPH